MRPKTIVIMFLVHYIYVAFCFLVKQITLMNQIT